MYIPYQYLLAFTFFHCLLVIPLVLLLFWLLAAICLSCLATVAMSNASADDTSIVETIALNISDCAVHHVTVFRDRAEVSGFSLRRSLAFLARFLPSPPHLTLGNTFSYCRPNFTKTWGVRCGTPRNVRTGRFGLASCRRQQ